MELEDQIPILPYQILPVTVVRLFLHENKTRFLVDVTCSVEDAVSPQRNLAVILLSGEADTFVYQTPADTETARFRLDQEQPKLRDGLGFLYEEDRANDFAIALRMVEGKKVMTDSAKIFIEDSRAFLMADCLPKIERCLEALTDEDV